MKKIELQEFQAGFERMKEEKFTDTVKNNPALSKALFVFIQNLLATIEAKIFDDNGNLKKFSIWDFIFDKSLRDFVIDLVKQILNFVKILKNAGLVILVMLLPALVFAQDSTAVSNPFEDVLPSLERFEEYYNWLYGVLILLWGQIAKALKLKAKFSNFVFVVIAGGLVIGGGFIYYGFDFTQIAFSLLATMGIFDAIRGTGKFAFVQKIIGLFSKKQKMA